MGKDYVEKDLFGWDNEFGHEKRVLENFEASQMLVSNAEYLVPTLKNVLSASSTLHLNKLERLCLECNLKKYFRKWCLTLGEGYRHVIPIVQTL